MPETYEIVLGKADGRIFTLYQCMTESATVADDREAHHVLSFDAAFEGARLASSSDLTFDRAVIQIDPLHDWAKWSTASGRISRNNDIEDGRIVQINVTYQPRDELRATTDQWEILLSERYSISQQMGRVELNTDHSLHVRLASPIPLNDWHTRILRPLQNFASLVSDQGARITGLVLLNSSRREGPRERRQPVPIRVRSHFIQHVEDERRHLVPRDFLVGLDEIAGRFQDVMHEWFRVSEDFRDACNLIFAPRYADNLYLESSFLMMAQGLEVFHRTKYSTATMIPQDEYTGLYEKLLAETPKRRRWLIEPRLKRGNEPFFKRRLVDLIEFAGDGFTDLAGTPDTWAGRVKDARNDLTHWSADRSGVEPGTDTFFQLLREATLLTKAVLLREIGFSTSECARLLSQNRVYRFMRGWN